MTADQGHIPKPSDDRVPLGYESGEVGGQAVLGGAVAGVLAHLLLHTDWRRELHRRGFPLAAPYVEEAARNMARAGHRWGAASVSGNAEGQGVADAPSSSSCLTVREVATLVRLSERRVRQLADAGLIDGVTDTSGRWQFTTEAVDAFLDQRKAG